MRAPDECRFWIDAPGKDVDTLTLNYSRQMAASLRSIESQIGGFASLLVRNADSLNASGGVIEGFNSNTIGSVLGKIPLIGGILKGLFGTKTTVVGSGLYGGAQSLESILGGGFDASYYSDVQKKKKFFGLTTSTKYSTQYSGADPMLENQFTMILRSFNAAILAAAGPLGAATNEIQQRLNGFTDLRATSARWVADADFAWLNFEGFYKDFSIDLAVPPLSFCTLTVEGLAETEDVPDSGADAAPAGSTSTILLVQPVAITDAILAASDVTENDFPEWAVGTTYALGARVLRGATHRVWESAASGNIGNDPTGASGIWIDIGPTNRWAMFDQALGTSTTRDGGMTLTLSAGATDALALLDIVGTTVRVQTTGYDQTKAIGEGAVTFLDLPGLAADVTVTIAGTGAVSVGTLLIGRLAALGVTGEAPTAGINDFSRKQVDDFGEPVIVERAWAKRMSAVALIGTGAVDIVANRIASVRAVPSLWIADEGTDSLIVYGFAKDFSIEVGENVSTLSLTVEGLSKAAPVDLNAPLPLPPTSNSIDPPAPAPIGHIWFDPSDGQHGYRQAGTTLTSGGFPVTTGGEAVTGSGWVSIQDRAASDAGERADDAIEGLYMLGEDGVLSVTEKIQALIPRSASLETAYSALSAAAATVGVSSAAASAARADWLAWLGAQVPAWDDVESDTAVNRLTYRTKLNAYDTALEQLGRAISEAASISLAVSPNAITLRADSTGQIFEGQLPFEFVPVLKSGTIIRNAGASWSMSLSPTLTGTQDTTSDTNTEGTVSITGATGDGSMTITAEGKSITARVTVQREAAGPDSPGPGGGTGISSTSSYGSVSSTSFPIDPPEIKTVRSDASGDLQFGGSWEYGGNGIGLAGKHVYRVAGSAGAWNDVAAATNGSLSMRLVDPPETINGAWSAMTAITLAASTDYEWGVMLRLMAGSGPITPFGASSVKQP